MVRENTSKGKENISKGIFNNNFADLLPLVIANSYNIKLIICNHSNSLEFWITEVIPASGHMFVYEVFLLLHNNNYSPLIFIPNATTNNSIVTKKSLINSIKGKCLVCHQIFTITNDNKLRLHQVGYMDQSITDVKGQDPTISQFQ
jgi:hypothetical protein